MKKLLLGLLMFSAGVSAAGSLKDKCLSVSAEKEGLVLIHDISSADIPGAETLTGIVYHNIANRPGKEGPDENYVKKAIEHLSVEKDTNALAKAYYGSTLTLMGSVNEKKKKLMDALDNLREGCDAIDEAVVMEPGSIDIRTLRLFNALEVSRASPVKRWNTAREDIDFLAASMSRMSSETRAMYFNASGEVGIAEKKSAAAIRDFRNAVAAAPDSPGGKKAKANLAKYAD